MRVGADQMRPVLSVMRPLRYDATQARSDSRSATLVLPGERQRAAWDVPIPFTVSS